MFNSTLELDVILQQVTRLATAVLGDSCTIALVEPGNAYLVPGASYHPDPQEQELRFRAQREGPVRIGDAESVMGLVASVMALAAADGCPGTRMCSAGQDRHRRPAARAGAADRAA